ncbi:hypothetical protein M2277_005096 [Paenibacillus sp. LBL]|uniref:DUF2828 family protein n=1 Tax=Paenibacillus sp. LBL TaxID=2940563 RepID=UPI0024737B76|nr:DUF2828 family protein [Paenibacillus sp. LBL]MDH6674404.1 hypothetical protein [Paenibacillus sp. LBL]
MLYHLKNEMNITNTLNGAKAHSTTQSNLLDFFAQGGAMRDRQEEDILRLFSRAYAEDESLALKMLFYFRDIREGQGERNTFRVILRYLANHYPNRIKELVELIPVYGRWDDLYVLFGTKLETEAIRVIADQLKKDLGTEKPSLMAKWLKSENTSSEMSKLLAKKTRKGLKMQSKEYRKTLSNLRNQIDVVERKMSASEWDEINYPGVPSKASLVYRNAFRKNDGDRYQDFIDSVANGNASINTKAIFPYEIVHKVFRGERDQTIDLMWDNLPDYVGKEENSMAVVDVSGSMSGLPMEVAVSIGLYLAERNKGHFHNHFITFSQKPELVQVTGRTVSEKIMNIQRAKWGYNTNIEQVFCVILNTAIKNNVPKDQMIEKLYIISDMQFDVADGSVDDFLFEYLKSKYAAAGYELPKLVFWNVDAKTEAYPATIHNGDVQLVSGCSPSLFKSLMKDEFLSPTELMNEILMSERYEPII